MSKLALCSRKDAIGLVLAGRVQVDGVTRCDPAFPVVPERASLSIDGREARHAEWTCLAFHKPRGVVTTRRDTQGRRTVYDVLGDTGDGVQAVGRLDLASSGLLLFTNDARFADWLTDPANGVERTYLVTVRGSVGEDVARVMASGIDVPVRGGGVERLRAAAVRVRKRSARETHLVVTLTGGRNREIRRLCDRLGHEVTRLVRISYGPLQLGKLAAGGWRSVARGEAEQAFPGARFSTAVASATRSGMRYDGASAGRTAREQRPR
jgi:23S rRNA pseudouridine2605 synthase